MKKILSALLAFVFLTAAAVYYVSEDRAYAVNASANDKQLLARAVNGEAR